MTSSIMTTSSPADKWNNCAFHDKRMKLGRLVTNMSRNIFGYKATSDWSHDQYGGSLQERGVSSHTFPMDLT